MKLVRNIKFSVSALLANRLRTWLSITAMSVSIAAAIVSISVGKAAREQTLAPLRSMGTRVLVVSAGKVQAVFGREKQTGNVTSLRLRDAVDLKAMEGVQCISAFQEALLQVESAGKTTTSLIQGVETEYPRIRNYQLQYGSFHTEADNIQSERVVVLGSQLSENLFGTENPVGRLILINRIPFTVIGTLRPKGVTGEMGNIDNVAMIPVNTLMRRVLNTDYLLRIYIQIEDEKEAGMVEARVSRQLRINHQLVESNAKDDFTIVNQITALRTAKSTSENFDVLISGVAILSLVVGGAGILAVMILSVRERIAEIGLRIAVGAKRKHILIQFLSEAFMVGITGGILGSLAGILAILLMDKMSAWPAQIEWEILLGAISFSVLNGLLFGIIPAWQAAKLDPITSLKQE